MHLQASIEEMSAAHAAALSALNERLQDASRATAQLEQQVKSGQGEVADLEARARALHRDLQVRAGADALGRLSRRAPVTLCCDIVEPLPPSKAGAYAL